MKTFKLSEEQVAFIINVLAEYNPFDYNDFNEENEKSKLVEKELQNLLEIFIPKKINYDLTTGQFETFEDAQNAYHEMMDHIDIEDMDEDEANGVLQEEFKDEYKFNLYDCDDYSPFIKDLSTIPTEYVS